MENTTADLAKSVENTPVAPFSNSEGFALAQRMGSALAQSSLVPEPYRGKQGLPNCMIALEMAHRVGISPFLVMQNMHIIHGRPSWSAQYLIASINASGKFSPLRFRLEKRGETKVGNASIDNTVCFTYATELATGETLEGPAVSMEMAVKEGWYGKNGSKWQTMPDLMLRYRAAAFFSRMYCPEVAMGLHTAEEVYDVYDAAPIKADAKERAKNLTEELLGTESAPEIETDFIPAEVQFAEPVVEAPAPAPEPPKRSEPKQTAQAPKQTQILPPDDAFDFHDMDDSQGEEPLF